MSTEIPDFKLGGMDDSSDNDFSGEILDDSYDSDEVGNAVTQETSESLKTSMELVLEREGNKLASETKDTSNETIDGMSPEEIERLKQMNKGKRESSDEEMDKKFEELG